jgi:flavin-dependent dehydrogenase
LLSVDVIIVGGGPAGSSCARRLRHKHGIDCLVLDREAFPRLKLCGGLLTREALLDLELDPASYPHGLLTIERFCFYFKGWKVAVPSPQYSIRRIELDKWLLDRAGAEVRRHYVRQIARDGDRFVIDDMFRCRYLVGAGGTRCPVHRAFFRDLVPRRDDLVIAALEEEFASAWSDPRCHLWYFDNQLPGYSWYIPKQGGYLNVGVGGMAASLNRANDSLKRHWEHLVASLARRGIALGHNWHPGGYTFYMTGRPSTARAGNALVTGDAAGLATHDLGEGIRPAVESGIRAADAIATGRDYVVADLVRYSAWSLLKGMLRPRSPAARGRAA